MIKRKYLNANVIKWIAIITMAIDHFGATIFQNIYIMSGDKQLEIYYEILRAIGRIAFPLFAFFVVEGFMHIKNDHKRLFRYISRLFIFLFISEIPFDIAFNNAILEFNSQNVYFTLLFGLLAITGIDIVKQTINSKMFNKIVKILMITISTVLISILFAHIANILKTDYSVVGVLTIVIIYVFYKHKELGLFFAITLLTMKSSLEIFSMIDILFIWQYNGQRGKQNKYFFYLFYPIHLLLFGIAANLII